MFLRGLEVAPSNRTARYNYARVLLALGRGLEAVRELGRLTDSAPVDLDVSLSLIEARLLAGERTRALADARELSETVGDGRALAALGRMLARAEEHGEAAGLLARAVQRFPEQAAPWLELARLRQGRGDHEGAVRAAERAARIAPDRLKNVLGFAETLISAERQEQARQYLVGLGPGFRARPGYFYTLGVALFGLHRYQESAAAFERAVELDPAWGTAHFLLGTSWLAAGEAENAVDAYRGAVDADPSNPLGFVYLARAYDKLGPQFAEAAVGAARQALRLDPENVECLTRVARQALEAGNTGKARETLERVVANHPDLRKPRILLTRAYYRLGMAREAAAQERKIRALQAEQQKRDTARGEAVREAPLPGLGLGASEIP